MSGEAAAGPGAVIAIHGLWSVFRREGADPAVVHRDLDLCVAPGELLVVVGASGSGKSVLLRQILGLEQPERGRIEVLGAPTAQLARAGAAGRIGMLFQQGALFSSFSALDNIALPLRELRALPAALVLDAAMVKLRMVGLAGDDGAKMPADLSGGMTRRAALARALVMDPPLLLLDEPTAGLDPISADGFVHLLRSLHRELGLTVLMVTHDLDTLFALATRVAVLADQRVITTGAPLEVAAFDHPFVRGFFRSERARRAMAPAPAS